MNLAEIREIIDSVEREYNVIFHEELAKNAAANLYHVHGNSRSFNEHTWYAKESETPQEYFRSYLIGSLPKKINDIYIWSHMMDMWSGIPSTAIYKDKYQSEIITSTGYDSHNDMIPLFYVALDPDENDRLRIRDAYKIKEYLDGVNTELDLRLAEVCKKIQEGLETLTYDVLFSRIKGGGRNFYHQIKSIENARYMDICYY